MSFPDPERLSGLPVVVTVIEAGPLEYQVCLLAESIRRWGGRLSAARIVAVKPRRGPNISDITREALERIDVEYREIDRDDRFQWFTYLNKSAVVRHVAGACRGPILWLDADILILDEPVELLIDRGDPTAPQFAACASDKNIGTANDDDEFAPYFRAVCQTLGVDFGSLPYVVTESERIPVRAYWNSGVYAFDAASRLAELHHDFTLKLVEERIGSHESKLYFSDQVALGLAVHRLALRYRNLPLSHNYPVQPDNVEVCLRNDGKDIRVLHYHGCLWPSSFDKLCEGLSVHRPDVAAWLSERGPLRIGKMSAVPRLHRKILQLYRLGQEKVSLRQCELH